jgi:hypothetical protein
MEHRVSRRDAGRGNISVIRKKRCANMSETMKIVLMILLTIGAFILTLRVAGWKMKRACDFILRDLTERKAFDPASAVELPYCKTSMFRIGMRDYRPQGAEHAHETRLHPCAGGGPILPTRGPQTEQSFLIFLYF